MKKINIAELLKDCPKGMELDCTVFENLTFEEIDEVNSRILCNIQGNNGKLCISFNKFGCYSELNQAKCVIFPKGKTTWEGFVPPDFNPPYQFKDGDVIVDKYGAVAIYKRVHNSFEEPYVDFHCGITSKNRSLYIKDSDSLQHCGEISSIRFASEEEKQELFKVIKDSGYEWNPETNTLEKLSKFQDGDILANGDTVFIYNGIEELSPFPSYYVYAIAEKNGHFAMNTTTAKKHGTRFATEEEKNILFEAIKNKGYKWYPDTKTLTKLLMFKDGDVITCNNSACTFISIFKDKPFEKTFRQHCSIITDNNKLIVGNKYADYANPRFATEAEKQKLFDAIKENGYRWNSESKTLENWTIQDAKDGDVIFYDDGWTCIFKCIHGIWYSSYCFITSDGEFHTAYETHAVDSTINGNAHPATKEQCNFLFQKIKEAGYKWNPETKTLEKLPKFKVGDEIVKKNSITNSYIVSSVSCDYYGLKLPNNTGVGVLKVDEQDEWELIKEPKFKVGDRIQYNNESSIRIIKSLEEDRYRLDNGNYIKFGDEGWITILPKFDITTLKPFDKVLVRDFDNETWEINFFSRLLDGKHFKCLDSSYVQCIPYEGNEHLYDTTNKCNNFYRTWENE